MDVDMDFSHPNLGALGIDNDALDINDLMDENILKSELFYWLFQLLSFLFFRHSS